MPTPRAIIGTVAALMNDVAQTQYTEAAVLPYFNLALDILQEVYELNGLPVTDKTSAAITVPAGVTRIGFDTTPAIPSNLIEIEQLWESFPGQNWWLPMTKKQFIPHYLQTDTTISQFLIWAWKDSAIEVIAANSDEDIKIDYISSIFNTPIIIDNINVNLPFTNIKTYLEFETAALCAIYIAENSERATLLAGQASDALSRALGIPVKGMQSIVTRRRPFRSSYRNRGMIY